MKLTNADNKLILRMSTLKSNTNLLLIKIHTFVNVFDLLSLSNHFYNKEKVTQKSSQKIIEQI